jgi:hypothetical protein
MPARPLSAHPADADAGVWPGGAWRDNELVIDIEPGRFEEMVTTALDGRSAITRGKSPSRSAVPSSTRSANYFGIDDKRLRELGW